MKFLNAVLALYFTIFTLSYVLFANLKTVSAEQQKSLNTYLQKQSSNQSDGQKMIIESDENAPLTKIPPISMNVAPLLQALLERVWVTKYFGGASEIFRFSSNMPFCDVLPDIKYKQDEKSRSFLWTENCLPIDIRWEVDKKDLGGVAVVRMLDFDEATSVLEEAFGLIRADTLGTYKIQDDQKEMLSKYVKEFLETKNIKPSSGYAPFFKTYPNLEGRFYLEKEAEARADTTRDFARTQEDIRQYFVRRGKKHALTIDYIHAKSVKNGNVIEYSLLLPKGFFGVEKAHQHKAGERK